ncbi:uncharacterized protein LOC133804595 isoform X2 [Humulus lupulus]|uniref:uncharacterized protein LOC133804595 isoform X2 n=1 Tax=Humulus lupulus TaxID=3486 RepID=UPI002B40C36A|nr:uncharacterized protein LOC133804595 isoform X2 [Humulus lupulus]
MPQFRQSQPRGELFTMIKTQAHSLSLSLSLYRNFPGAMNPDLDAVLFSDGGAGAQKSKRPRIPKRPDRQSKVSKRHETTPTAQITADTSKEPTAQVDGSGSTASISQLPTETRLIVARPPKKPSTSTVQLPTARTHTEEYVLDGTAGAEGALLSSDVLSRVGQSFSGFGADHWDLVRKASDCNTLYEKSIELSAAALVVSAQLNYKLTNEVQTSLNLAQKSKDLELKMIDELKDSKSEIERLKTRLEELEKSNAELEKAKAKLEEEKSATFDFMESEKTRLLDEAKEQREKAVDQAMYKLWADNDDLDTSFLGPLEATYVERWNARLLASTAAREVAQQDSHAIRPGGSGDIDAEKAKDTPLP